MRLKWLLVRLRRRRVGPLGGLPTTLHFCGEPANGSCPRPRRASGKVAPRSRGELIARRLDVPVATEESCESSHVAAQASPEAGPLSFGRCPRPSLRAVAVDGPAGRAGGRSHLALRSLVPGWPHPTRLETRTKECNMRASLRVANPWAK